MLWEFEYRQGWTGKDIGAKDIAALLGRAFGAGMQLYNESWEQSPAARYAPTLWEAAIKHAHHAFDVGLAQLADDGFNLEALADCGDIKEALSDSVLGACKNDPTPPEWRVHAVEKSRPDWGFARADVVYTLPNGSKIVRDYKFTLKLDSKWVDKRLDKYARAAQVPHYLMMEDAAAFIVTLVRNHPFKIYERIVYLDEQRRNQWYGQQQIKWDVMAGMATGNLPLWESDKHEDEFGVCPLVDFCLTHHRNVESLPVLGFVKRSRSK